MKTLKPSKTILNLAILAIPSHYELIALRRRGGSARLLAPHAVRDLRRRDEHPKAGGRHAGRRLAAPGHSYWRCAYATYSLYTLHGPYMLIYSLGASFSLRRRNIFHDDFMYVIISYDYI